MKVAVIGATSQSTPTLFQALADSPARPELRFALAARNTVALKAVCRAIALVSVKPFAIQCNDFSVAGLIKTIEDAAIVVIQVRYGGLDGRDFDERFPLGFGICGDEGLGPGGLSSAWRSWHALSELLQLIERTQPSAQIVLLTSPCSLLTRLAHMRWPELKVSAICELPMTTLQSIQSGSLGFDYLGINHLGWLYNIANRLPVPLKYWRLQFDREQYMAEQTVRIETRARELQRLREKAFVIYATGSREDIIQTLAQRLAPWYTHALAPLLESSITHESPCYFFFSEPNSNWNSDFENSDVLEIPYCWQAGKLCRKPIHRSAPEELVATLKPLVAYERLAATAIIDRDPRKLEYALSEHPWVGSKQYAKQMAQVIVTQSV